jgi:hypothetical protein
LLGGYPVAILTTSSPQGTILLKKFHSSEYSTFADCRHMARQTRSVIFMKIFHVAVSFLIVGCLFYTLFAALTHQITNATWLAFGIVTMEIAILIRCGWKCPLTSFTESLGAKEGSVTRLFLPEFLAKNLFSIFRVLYVICTFLLIVQPIFR